MANCNTRDCKNCKHYVLQNVKINLPGYPDTKYYGCENWDCEFEPKEGEGVSADDESNKSGF